MEVVCCEAKKRLPNVHIGPKGGMAVGIAHQSAKAPYKERLGLTGRMT